MTGSIESALAAHRVTRLITGDRITRPWRHHQIEHAYELREKTLAGTWWRSTVSDEMKTRIAAAKAVGDWERVVHLDPHPPGAAVWVSCAWCAGVWVAAGVAVLDARGGRWWGQVRRWLAVADLVGLIAGHE